MKGGRGSDGSRRIRSLNIGAVAAVLVCLAAGVFELDRALGGNDLSWVYAVEWPLIGAYLVYMRRRLVRESRGHVGPGAPASRRPPGTPAAPADARPDAELTAWRDYLARLHAADPPGGPPVRPRDAGSREMPR